MRATIKDTTSDRYMQRTGLFYSSFFVSGIGALKRLREARGDASVVVKRSFRQGDTAAIAYMA